MTELLVRPADPDDLSRMSALWYEHAALLAQQDTRWVLQPDAALAWRQAAHNWLSHPQALVLVTCEDDVITGFIVAMLQDAPAGFMPARLGVILSIAIDAHHHSSGAARMLVEAARQWCKEQDVEQIVIDVPKRAAIEQAFWRAQGGLPWTERLWIP